MPGDLAQDVYGDAGVGHPGQSGVAEAVSAEVFVAEFGDDVVPVGGVAQDRGGDATAAGPVNRRASGLAPADVDAAADDVADLDDERNGAGAFALGAFVGESAG